MNTTFIKVLSFNYCLIVNKTMKSISIIFLGLILFLGNINGIHSIVDTFNEGDEEASVEDYPYHASLRVKGQHVCSGAIIDEFHVLTSATCATQMRNFSLYELTVATGTTIKEDLVLIVGEHIVKHIYVHPYYGKTGNYSNDVAIVKLENKIKFDKYQKPVALSFENTYPGDIGVVTGWRDSLKLRKADMVVLSKERCHKSFKLDITDGTLCVKNLKGAFKHQGENGSPLVINGKVVGIASCILNSQSQCVHGSPDIYTDTYIYGHYIYSVLRDYDYPPLG